MCCQNDFPFFTSPSKGDPTVFPDVTEEQELVLLHVLRFLVGGFSSFLSVLEPQRKAAGSGQTEWDCGPVSSCKSCLGFQNFPTQVTHCFEGGLGVSLLFSSVKIIVYAHRIKFISSQVNAGKSCLSTLSSSPCVLPEIILMNILQYKLT